MDTLYLKVFHDMLPVIDQLTDEDAGKLIKSILAYSANGDTRDVDGVALGVFLMEKNRIDRERKQDAARSATQTENGKKGGRPKKEQCNDDQQDDSAESDGNPTKPNETQQNPTKPNETQANPKNPNYNKDYNKEKEYNKDHNKDGNPNARDAHEGGTRNQTRTQPVTQMGTYTQLPRKQTRTATQPPRYEQISGRNYADSDRAPDWMIAMMRELEEEEKNNAKFG